MMKRLLTILCIPAVLLLGAAEARSADFQKGLEAYEAGDYAAALHEFRPLAEQGVVMSAMRGQSGSYLGLSKKAVRDPKQTFGGQPPNFCF